MENNQAQTDLTTNLTIAAYVRAQKTLLRLLEDHGGQMTRRDILRAMTYLRLQDLDDVLESLLEQEWIKEVRLWDKGLLRQGYRRLSS